MSSKESISHMVNLIHKLIIIGSLELPEPPKFMWVHSYLSCSHSPTTWFPNLIFIPEGFTRILKPQEFAHLVVAPNEGKLYSPSPPLFCSCWGNFPRLFSSFAIPPLACYMRWASTHTYIKNTKRKKNLAQAKLTYVFNNQVYHKLPIHLWVAPGISDAQIAQTPICIIHGQPLDKTY